MIGIYCIENIVNHKKYIGQSVNIEKRFKSHIQKLNKNIHINEHLQSSWNKHGKNNFEFFVLEYCHEKQLNGKEDFWINKFLTTNSSLGYNKRDASSKGKLSQETKDKISKANKKNPPTKKCLEISAEKRRGVPLSLEHRIHISEGLKGTKHSEEFKIKISKAKKGTKHSEESISKMIDVKKGINNPGFGKKRAKSTSAYFGVSFNKSRNKWIAQTSSNKKHIFLGYFLKEKDAANAYNTYIIQNRLPNPMNIIEKEE